LPEHERENRTALKDLAAQALSQLTEAGIDKRRIAPLEEQFRHLAGTEQPDPDDDKIRKLQNKKPDPIDEFWKFQGHSLAVLATPQMMRTFRLPYRPKPLAEVADRFHLTPLIRAMTSPQDIFVLALAEKGVRLVRVFVNLPPTRIHVPELPKDAEEVAHRASIRERNWKGHLQGSEAAKFLLHKFARRVDHALHGVLAGRSAPLVLAADEPLASIYRSVNTYPGLIDETIDGNPNLMTDAQLEDAALPMLDRLYKRALKAAMVIPGLVSEFDGSVTYATSDDAEVTVSSMKSRAGRSIPARGCSVRGAMSCPTGRLWSPSCVISSGEGFVPPTRAKQPRC
jgi:hypothetical protein